MMPRIAKHVRFLPEAKATEYAPLFQPRKIMFAGQLRQIVMRKKYAMECLSIVPRTLRYRAFPAMMATLVPMVTSAMNKEYAATLPRYLAHLFRANRRLAIQAPENVKSKCYRTILYVMTTTFAQPKRAVWRGNAPTLWECLIAVQ